MIVKERGLISQDTKNGFNRSRRLDLGYKRTFWAEIVHEMINEVEVKSRNI